MKKTIYLHIGTNKTGSSAVQFFMNENREQLLKNGFYIPKDVHDNAHYQLTYSLGLGPNLLNVDKELFLASLKEEITSCSADKIIISSEYFILAKDTSLIKKYFENFDVNILVYFRRHDLWIESLYNQAVKTVPEVKWKLGILNYIDFLSTKSQLELSYKKIIETWEKYFDHNRMYARAYEKEQFKDGDIILDFLSFLGIDSSEGFAMTKESVNQSIPIQYIGLLEAAKKSRKFDNKQIVKLLKFFLSKSNDKSYSLLSDEKRIEIIESKKEEYKWISESFNKENEFFFKHIDFEPSENTINSEVTLNFALELLVENLIVNPK